jgi:hypothetical protein
METINIIENKVEVIKQDYTLYNKEVLHACFISGATYQVPSTNLISNGVEVQFTVLKNTHKSVTIEVVEKYNGTINTSKAVKRLNAGGVGFWKTIKGVEYATVETFNATKLTRWVKGYINPFNCELATKELKADDVQNVATAEPVAEVEKAEPVEKSEPVEEIPKVEPVAEVENAEPVEPYEKPTTLKFELNTPKKYHIDGTYRGTNYIPRRITLNITLYNTTLENLFDVLNNIISTYLDKDMKENVYQTLLDIANDRNKRKLENNSVYLSSNNSYIDIFTNEDINGYEVYISYKYKSNLTINDFLKSYDVINEPVEEIPKVEPVEIENPEPVQENSVFQEDCFYAGSDKSVYFVTKRSMNTIDIISLTNDYQGYNIPIVNDIYDNEYTSILHSNSIVTISSTDFKYTKKKFKRMLYDFVNNDFYGNDVYGKYDEKDVKRVLNMLYGKIID